MNKLLENIKTFGYKVPDDPEKLLYDFYFMAGWMPHSHEDKVIDFVFKEALKDCTTALQEHLLVALYWSLAAEIRHIFVYSRMRPGRTGYEKEVAKLPDDIKAFLKKYYTNLMKYGSDVLGMLEPDRVKNLAKGNRLLKHSLLKGRRGREPEGRNATYQESFLALESARKSMDWSKLEAVRALKYLYGDVTWDGSYGGDAWASIADAYIKLVQATTSEERVIYIDHAYDLQHNTGSVFTKVKNYYKNGGLSWLSNALDWKRDTKDIRSYYDKVSSSLRPVVAWVAKDKYGLTMEDYKTPREIDAEKRAAKASATEKFVDSMTVFMKTGEPFSFPSSSIFLPVGGFGADSRRDLKNCVKKLFPNIQEPSSIEYLVSASIHGWQIMNPNSAAPVLTPVEAKRPKTPADVLNTKDVLYVWKQLSALYAKPGQAADKGALSSLPVDDYVIDISKLDAALAAKFPRRFAMRYYPEALFWPGGVPVQHTDFFNKDAKYLAVYPGRGEMAVVDSPDTSTVVVLDAAPLLDGKIVSISEPKSPLPEKFYIIVSRLSRQGKQALLKKLAADVLPQGSQWYSSDELTSGKVPLDDDILALTRVGDGTYRAGKAGKGYISTLEQIGAQEITEEEILQGKYDRAPEIFSGRAPDETTYKGGSAVNESRDFHEFFKLKEAVTMAQVGGKLLANASHFAKNMSLIQDFRISDLPAGVSTPEDLMYDLATSKARGRVLPDNVVEQLKNLQVKHGGLRAGISAWLKANPDANTILNELLRQGVTASTIQKADTGAVKRTGTAAQLQAVARR